MRIENIVDIKLKNVYNIVECIRYAPGITKREVMEKLNLSFATVSNICKELAEAGVLLERKQENAPVSVGRFPMELVFQYDKFLIACIDLHIVATAQVALLNLRNEIVAQTTFQYDPEQKFEEFVEMLCVRTENCIKENGMNRNSLVGVAAAIPGIYDQYSGNVVASLIPAIENQPLKEKMEKRLGMKVYIDNESNASVVAALTYPESRKVRNLVYLLFSSGIGVGVISDGMLISGARGYAAEVCHMPIGSKKLRCRLCGEYGCVESDLSISGFCEKYRMRTQQTVNWHEFVSKAQQKDAAAQEVIQENAVIMGQLISVLVNMFDPDLVYVGGDVASLFNGMKQTVQQEVEKRAVIPALFHTEILADLHEDALMQGCAEQVFRRLDFTRLSATSESVRRQPE